MQITPITAGAAIAWYDAPSARAYIDAIDPADLSLERPRLVMGDNLLHFTGEPVEDLSKIREDLIEAAFGCTFREAEDQGRRNEYLDFCALHASVDEGLATRFGSPRQFCPMMPHDATRAMRFNARAAGEGRAA